MTDAQKARIISAYNAAVADQIKAETGLDSATTDKTWARHANKHSFALGQQQAIDNLLSILGYDLIVNDEDIAIDIQPKAL